MLGKGREKQPPQRRNSVELSEQNHIFKLSSATYIATQRSLNAAQAQQRLQPVQKAAAVIIQSKAKSEWKGSIGKALCFIGGGLTIAGFTHLNPGLIAFGIICMLVGAALIDKASKELKEQAKANPAFFAKADGKSAETPVFSPYRTGRQAVFR